jgi:2'-5' RNA ligase superfamily
MLCISPLRILVLAIFTHSRALQMSSSTGAAARSKTHASTVALVPPEASWERIQRARYELQDKGLYRWPPHCNLLYPFVEKPDFEICTAAITDALVAVQVRAHSASTGASTIVYHHADWCSMHALCLCTAIYSEVGQLWHLCTPSLCDAVAEA